MARKIHCLLLLRMCRMDLRHHYCLMSLGGLHRAPLLDPERILDCGTGTGIWATVGGYYTNLIDVHSQKAGYGGEVSRMRDNRSRYHSNPTGMVSYNPRDVVWHNDLIVIYRVPPNVSSLQLLFRRVP